MNALHLQFCPNQKNPARQSGKGVYRVVGCVPSKVEVAIRALHDPVSGGSILQVPCSRMLKRGSRVDPARTAIEARSVIYFGSAARG